MMGPLRAQQGQQGQAVRWTPADMGANMEMPLGPMGPNGPRQQAVGAPINALDVMGQQGQAAVGTPGPLGALQDSFAAGNPVQQMDQGNPSVPPVAPIGNQAGLAGPVGLPQNPLAQAGAGMAPIGLPQMGPGMQQPSQMGAWMQQQNPFAAQMIGPITPFGPPVPRRMRRPRRVGRYGGI